MNSYNNNYETINIPNNEDTLIIIKDKFLPKNIESFKDYIIFIFLNKKLKGNILEKNNYYKCIQKMKIE